MADVTLKKMSGAPAKLPNIAIGGSAAEAFRCCAAHGQDLTRSGCSVPSSMTRQDRLENCRELDELMLEIQGSAHCPVGHGRLGERREQKTQRAELFRQALFPADEPQ